MAGGFGAAGPSAFGQAEAGRGRLRLHGSNNLKVSRGTRPRAAVGIDLGTTNSAVAVVQDGTPSIIRNADGSSTIPSVVAFTKDGRTLVGREAAMYGVEEPRDTFSSVKRVIGRRYENAVKVCPSTSFSMVCGSNGAPLLHVPARDAALRPEEVLSHVVKKLLEQAEQHLGERVDRAVVTVPAYFDQQQQLAVMETAAMAGLDRVSLLQEPVAAAMAYGLGRAREEQTILVFDLGGGTFDVSLLESFEGIIEVLGFSGDANLGGDDFDATLMSWLQQQQEPPPQPLGGVALQQLREAAVAAKERLSIDNVAQIRAQHGGMDVHEEVTRSVFEQLTAGLRQRLWAPMQELAGVCCLEWSCWPPEVATMRPTVSAALHEAAAAGPSAKYAPQPRRVSQLVLVGGSTRIPSVKAFCETACGVPACSAVDPELCVALGAAIQAAMMEGHISGLELMDGSYVWESHGRSSGFQM